MEISTQKQLLNLAEKSKEITVEQSVDTEFTLPDYYPEITKILKCLTEVNVINKQIRENSAEIGGQVSLTLLYADKENTINSFSHVYPFTKSVDIEQISDDTFLTCVLRGEYLNSKATAPRRIEIHGSITLGITTITQTKLQCITQTNEQNIFAKTSNIDYYETFLPISKSIFLEDEIGIGTNQNSISKILRSHATAVINECKIITNKIVVKGQLNISILYCTVQSSRPVLVNHIHHFSQIIDIDNELENATCHATASISTFELHPKTSLDGEVKSVTFESKVTLEVTTERKNAICVLTDAYNNCSKSNISFIPVDCLVDSEKICENYCFNKSLEFSDGAIGEIYDLWCKTRVNFVSCDNGDVHIKGVVVINILGCDESGAAVFYERTVDYEYHYSYNDKECDCKFKYEVLIAAFNYSRNQEGGIDISIELNVCGEIFKYKTIKAISEIAVSDQVVLKDNDTAITLYFAEGETVWEIAKKYLSDPNKICQVNNIESIDEICNKILLIPNI